MKFIKIAWLALWSLSAFADGNDSCSALNIRSQWAAMNSLPLAQFSWDRLRSKELIFIGDFHMHTRPEAVFQVVDQIGKRKNSCVFFELPSSATLKLLEPEAKDSGDQSKIKRYYKAMIAGFSQRGFTVHFVDNWNLSSEQREENLEENIERLFSRGRCESGIMIIGVDHIAPGNLPAQTAVAMLSLQHSVAKIALLFSGDLDVPELSTWSKLCPAVNAFTPAEAVVFDNSGIKYQRIFPNYTRSGRFGQFDLTILSPLPGFQ